MAKIQVTDDADTKKQAAKATAEKNATAKVASGKNALKVANAKTAVKKSVKKVSVDTTSVNPKKIKKIKVEKAEKKAPKAVKTKKSVKIEKSEPQKTEIAIRKKKTVSEISVQSKQESKPQEAEITAQTEEKANTRSRARHASAASSNATHSMLQKSTTLSRRYVKRPSATPINENEIKVSIGKGEARPQSEKPSRAQSKAERQAAKLAKAQAKLAEKRAKAEAEAARKAKVKAEKLAAIEAAKAQKAAAIEAARVQKLAAAKAAREAKLAKKQARTAMPVIKASAANKTAPDRDRVLKNAMHSVATMNAEDSPREMHREFRKQKKGGRIALALFCSAVTVAALVAFVHFNMPDISVKVAAIQTGIDASYPSIVPRGYNLSNVSSDKDGEIAMVFSDSDGNSFTLTEEKSTWDSNALLNNYVKKIMSAEYSTMREQGITIYSESGVSAWVNGGILFKVKCYGKFLTKEQLRNLATSV